MNGDSVGGGAGGVIPTSVAAPPADSKTPGRPNNTVNINNNTTDPFFFACPGCSGTIQVERDQVNCTIFRHASYKANGMQINPHMPREECERLVKAGLVYGCAKPFKFDGKNVTVCDYI